MGANSPAPPTTGGLPSGFWTDGPTILGHKVSWAAIGGLAAAGGLFLVIRARATGSNLASVGTAPATTAAPATSDISSGIIDPDLLGGTGAAGSDDTGQLDTLSQQVGDISQQLTGAGPSVIGIATTRGASQNAFGQSVSPGAIPVYATTTASSQNEIGTVQPNSQVEQVGAPVESASGSSWFWPIAFGGGTGYLQQADILGQAGKANATTPTTGS